MCLAVTTETGLAAPRLHTPLTAATPPCPPRRWWTQESVLSTTLRRSPSVAKPHAHLFTVRLRQTQTARVTSPVTPCQTSVADRGDGRPRDGQHALEAESSHFPRHYSRRSRRNGRNYNTDVNNLAEWTSLSGAAAGNWARGRWQVSGLPAATLTTAAPPALPVQSSHAPRPSPSLLLSRCLTRNWSHPAALPCT